MWLPLSPPPHRGTGQVNDEERAAKLIQLVEENRWEGETFDEALDVMLSGPRLRVGRWWRMGHPLPP